MGSSGWVCALTQLVGFVEATRVGIPSANSEEQTRLNQSTHQHQWCTPVSRRVSVTNNTDTHLNNQEKIVHAQCSMHCGFAYFESKNTE